MSVMSVTDETFQEEVFWLKDAAPRNTHFMSVTIAPVDNHVRTYKWDGDGLVGGVGLPGGDKRALVRLCVRHSRTTKTTHILTIIFDNSWR